MLSQTLDIHQWSPRSVSVVRVSASAASANKRTTRAPSSECERSEREHDIEYIEEMMRNVWRDSFDDTALDPTDPIFTDIQEDLEEFTKTWTETFKLAITEKIKQDSFARDAREEYNRELIRRMRENEFRAKMAMLRAFGPLRVNPRLRHLFALK